MSGGAERNRTADLDNANVALSQLSYGPEKRSLIYHSLGAVPSPGASPCRPFHPTVFLPTIQGMRISVIVPVLNEAEVIAASLAPIQSARAAGHEVLVVDGGSVDGTQDIAASLADRVVEGPLGRAAQMNQGADLASGDVYWFLHADTQVPDGAIDAIVDACSGGRRAWGYFRVRLNAPGAAFRMIGTAMTWRSRLTGIATGDQGLFCSRRLFDSVGGFPSMPLMEDVALSRALRQRQLPVCLPHQLHTSARRWQERGTWRTVLLMWRLRLAFFLGADPARLHHRYYGPQA